jgi:hypothetical protein
MAKRREVETFRGVRIRKDGRYYTAHVRWRGAVRPLFAKSMKGIRADIDEALAQGGRAAAESRRRRPGEARENPGLMDFVLPGLLVAAVGGGGYLAYQATQPKTPPAPPAPSNPCAGPNSPSYTGPTVPPLVASHGVTQAEWSNLSPAQRALACSMVSNPQGWQQAANPQVFAQQTGQIPPNMAALGITPAAWAAATPAMQGLAQAYAGSSPALAVAVIMAHYVNNQSGAVASSGPAASGSVSLSLPSVSASGSVSLPGGGGSFSLPSGSDLASQGASALSSLTGGASGNYGYS